MGRVGTASAQPRRIGPQPAALTAAAQSAHAVSASGQILPNPGQRTGATVTAGAATTQQAQAGTHPRPALRHQTPAALQHQHQHSGSLQSPGQTPAPAAPVGGKYASRTPTGGPHVRSIFYNPNPTAAVPSAAASGAAERAWTEAEGGDGLAQGQAHAHVGSGHGSAASAAPHSRPDAGHAEMRAPQQPSDAPQRLVLPPPNAVLGSTRQAASLTHGNAAGQASGDCAGQRHTHSAPSAAGKHQLHQRPTPQDGCQPSGAGNERVQPAIRSAPAGSAAQSARPMMFPPQQQRQQQQRPSPQKQHPDSSGSAFQQFACDVQHSMSPSRCASVRPAQPAGPGAAAAATGGATRQQRILPSLMRGSARPVPPPARPGNEFCTLEIQLGEQTGTLEVHAKDRYFNDAAQAAMLRCSARWKTVLLVSAARRSQ